MPKKMGRPTDNPKYDRATVRMDINTKAILDAYCKQEKVEMAVAIRRAIAMLETELKKR